MEFPQRPSGGAGGLAGKLFRIVPFCKCVFAQRAAFQGGGIGRFSWKGPEKLSRRIRYCGLSEYSDAGDLRHAALVRVAGLGRRNWMKVLALVVGMPLFGALLFAATGSAAADSRFERSLKMLDPTARLEQICDYTAMKQINAARNPFHPDRVVANAVAQSRISVDTVHAAGGAFRSHGKWYELAYSCKTTPDHLKVLSFDYRIGSEIPEAKWATYDLWR